MPDNAFTTHLVPAQDGLLLSIRIYCAAKSLDSNERPVICLPGLTRNGRDFHQLACLLSSDDIAPRRVITIDSRGRGGSQRDPDPGHYTVGQEAADVATVCSALGITRADFIGTSRGGLILHILPLVAPDLVASAVLNDVGPVLGVAGLAEIQAYLSAGRRPVSWSDAADLLRDIHARNFPILDDHDWADMAQALYIESDGKLVADFDPAIAAATAALDLSQPLPDLWPQFDLLAKVPVLVIRAEHSKLLTEETVTLMQGRAQQLTSSTALGQGHAPMLHLGSLPQVIRTFWG